MDQDEAAQESYERRRRLRAVIPEPARCLASLADMESRFLYQSMEDINYLHKAQGEGNLRGGQDRRENFKNCELDCIVRRRVSDIAVSATMTSPLLRP